MNLLLLDADVIIDLHKLELWKQVTKKHKVYVASTVLHNEAYYYEDDKGRHPIEVANIEELSATPQEIQQLYSKFNPAYLELHQGELESLAILINKSDIIFCTCDRAAVIASVLLDITERLVSVEKMLGQSGLSSSRLEPKHTENKFKNYVKQGQQMKIQGTGLR